MIAFLQHTLIPYDDIDTITPYGNKIFGYGTYIQYHDFNYHHWAHLSVNPKKVRAIFEKYKHQKSDRKE